MGLASLLPQLLEEKQEVLQVKTPQYGQETRPALIAVLLLHHYLLMLVVTVVLVMAEMFEMPLSLLLLLLPLLLLAMDLREILQVLLVKLEMETPLTGQRVVQGLRLAEALVFVVLFLQLLLLLLLVVGVPLFLLLVVMLLVARAAV
jgi:hypothetical protein